jgi:hypothetical protein
MVRAALAMIVGAILCARPAAAQSRWESQVGEQLVTASRVFSERGFELTHDKYTGTLHQNEFEFLTVTLHAGTSYALVGVCDNDCRDLDLALFDPDGREVDADRKLDDAPVVVATPSVTGQYRVKVVMAQCATSPCFYGIGIYGR